MNDLLKRYSVGVSPRFYTQVEVGVPEAGPARVPTWEEWRAAGSLPWAPFLAPYKVRYRQPGEPWPSEGAFPLSHFSAGPFCQCTTRDLVAYTDPAVCCQCGREIQSCSCEGCTAKLGAAP